MSEIQSIPFPSVQKSAEIAKPETTSSPTALTLTPETKALTSFSRHIAAAWNESIDEAMTTEERVQTCLIALEQMLKLEQNRDAWDTLVSAVEHVGKHEIPFIINGEQVLPQFTRRKPTNDHTQLISHYLNMHAHGYKASNGVNEHQMKPEEAYPGNELPKFAGAIKTMIDKHQAKSIMDYGCGKGKQYGPAEVKDGNGKIFKSIPEFWAVDKVHCYDPCVPAFCKLPPERFDGVVSTDVLEHCFIDDVPWIVREMFSYARKFVFVNIACFPAIARLPNGDNAHCTVKSADWWFGLFHSISHEFHDIDYLVCCTVPMQTEQGMQFRQAWHHRKAA